VTAAFPTVISVVLSGRRIDQDTARSAFESILAGAWTSVQVAAFAIGLRMRGETAEVISAAAQAVRGAMTTVAHDFPIVVDTCGTGGDGAHTLNISSAAAVVVAACDLPVAKHGNRSASSRCGSADVYEAMGIPIDVPPQAQSAVLREAGMAFLFAQAHHPALKHAAAARRELATRTIFNVLGPLANPAGATHQLVGVYEDALRPVMAQALGHLGTTRAWVVHSEDGLDEVSPCAPTRVTEWAAGGTRELIVSPEDFGLERLARASLAGGSAAENAMALGAILDGEPHPARGAVILNAAAALVLATGDPPRRCADRATAAIDGGAARKTFERWRRAAIRARAQ